MEIAYLVVPIDSHENSAEKISELTSLVQSAGAVVCGYSTVKINKIVPATYIGSGTCERIKNLAESENADLIVFDGELTPSQTLNLSSALGDIKVIDRTTLILDIFALSAKSAEGKIQVELAQLNYIYPRLKGKGSALSRLGGGIGTRGPGETQLETDRRHIRRRINFLEEKLVELEKRRALQSERRTKNANLKVALVGYTNTGKSTLLNVLTGSSVIAEDKLFATLDPTTRKLNLGEFNVLISDTVGFIKNVPTTLIEAFKSTLETAIDADLVLIICDAKGDWQSQYETTNEMLDELKVKSHRITVMNKCEQIDDFTIYPNNAEFISAKFNVGLDALKQRIKNFFASNYCKIDLKLPYCKIKEYFALQKYVASEKIIYSEEYVKIEALIPKIHVDKFNKLYSDDF